MQEDSEDRIEVIPEEVREAPTIDNLVGKPRKFADDFIEFKGKEGIFEMMGVKPDKTFLIYGPPATGKTLALSSIYNTLCLPLKNLEKKHADMGLPTRIKPTDFPLMYFTYDIGKYGTAYINMNSRRVQDFFDKVGMYAKMGVSVLVGIDECLTGDTNIVMEDGSIKKIKYVKDGDRVYLGGKVSNKFHKQVGALRRIRTSFGELDCTLTHPHMVLEGDKLVKKPTKDLKEGDIIVSPQTYPHKHTFNWTPEQLHFVGMVMADGHMPITGNMIRVSVSKDKDWYKEMFTRGANSFGVKEVFSTENSRGDLNLWTNDKSLCRIMNEVFEIPFGKKSSDIIINEQIKNSSSSAIRGFLDGYICSEGTVGRVVSTTSNSKAFTDSFVELLRLFCINGHYTIDSRKRGKTNHEKSYKLTFKYPFILSMTRKEIKRMQVSHKWKPDKTTLIGGIWYLKGKVNKIEKIIPGLDASSSVYDFTTERGIFVANNILTHNCDGLLVSRQSNIQSHSEDRKTLETIMKNLQVMHDTPNAYVVMMTNLPEICDDAALRAGRIDRRIKFDLPDLEERTAAYNHFISHLNNTAAYTVIRGSRAEELASLSQGFNYADIKQVVYGAVKDKASDISKNTDELIMPAGYVTQRGLLSSLNRQRREFHTKKQTKRIGF
jgi:hypothetical protein